MGSVLDREITGRPPDFFFFILILLGCGCIAIVVIIKPVWSAVAICIYRHIRIVGRISTLEHFNAISESVIVVNAGKVAVTGKKETDKVYHRHSGYPGGLTQSTFEELLEKDKSVIAYHIGLGQTLVALDQWSDAVDVFEKALALFPRNVPLVIEYGERLLELEAVAPRARDRA